jgi:gamma-glutamyl-gamma-aminobutyrate hydrolase PuuD
MKVAFATHALSYSFLGAFPDAKVLGSHENFTPDIDLLIFTGGEDVSPSRYGETVSGAYGINDRRDEAEFGIFDVAVRNSRTKILGVCRGLQLINVALGGTLIQDLPQFDMIHDHIHDLRHRTKNVFSDLVKVNSLHHQGILRSGGQVIFTGKQQMERLDFVPLAVHPGDDLVEMAMWGKRILATQFHPEFFEDDKYHWFFNKVKDWVEKGVPIYEPESDLSSGWTFKTTAHSADEASSAALRLADILIRQRPSQDVFQEEEVEDETDFDEDDGEEDNEEEEE